MKRTKEELKEFFQTGDRPTENQFGDLIDSIVGIDEAKKVVLGDTVKEFNHTELNSIVEKSELTPGLRYILTGYQTKYYIEGSNTSNIIKTITNDGVVTGWGFYDPPLSDLKIGSEITIASLPSGYTGTIKVGDKTTVTQYHNNGSYLMFANGFQVVKGGSFTYSIQRYSNITPDSKILDAKFKPVMQPNGIINTDVHDGTDYMDMSAAENKKVPTEKLILTAISKNTFSIHAESLTYPGEILEYHFNDKDIKNENGKVIGTRSGYIRRRISADKKININKDWRVYRFRRYKVADADWANYILTNTKDHSIYKIGTHHSATVANTTITDNHKYIAPYVEMKRFYQDHTYLGNTPNIYTTGKDQAQVGSIAYGYQMEKVGVDEFKQDIKIAAPKHAKDFFIVPLDNNLYPQDNVRSLVVNYLENTVFMNNPSQYVKNNVIDVHITDGISTSTFVAGAKIYSSSERRTSGLKNITVIDKIDLYNTGKIENLSILATLVLENNGDLNYVTIGGMASNAYPYGPTVTWLNMYFDRLTRIQNTIIGGKRTDRLFFNNVQASKCLFLLSKAQYLKFTNSILFLTGIKHSTDFFTNTIQIDTTFKNTTKNKWGYWYDMTTAVSGKNIIRNNKGDLLYQEIDGNNNNSTKFTTLTNPK